MDVEPDEAEYLSDPIEQSRCDNCGSARCGGLACGSSACDGYANLAPGFYGDAGFGGNGGARWRNGPICRGEWPMTSIAVAASFVAGLANATSSPPRDFFISYNSEDKEWAEWIAWVLEENEHRE